MVKKEWGGEVWLATSIKMLIVRMGDVKESKADKLLEGALHSTRDLKLKMRKKYTVEKKSA